MAINSSCAITVIISSDQQPPFLPAHTAECAACVDVSAWCVIVNASVKGGL